MRPLTPEEEFDNAVEKYRALYFRYLESGKDKSVVIHIVVSFLLEYDDKFHSDKYLIHSYLPDIENWPICKYIREHMGEIAAILTLYIVQILWDSSDDHENDNKLKWSWLLLLRYLYPGADAVKYEHRGNIIEMYIDWITWGYRRGYIELGKTYFENMERGMEIFQPRGGEKNGRKDG